MFAPWRSHNSLREPRKNVGVWQPANHSFSYGVYSSPTSHANLDTLLSSLACHMIPPTVKDRKGSSLLFGIQESK